MADELIRLDTTIIGIDSLINKASTVEEAKVLFTVKDVIYSQQRYVTDVQPVKRGKWLKHGKDDDYLWCCSACKKWVIYAEHDLHKHHFCGNCGADMRQEESNEKTN